MIGDEAVIRALPVLQRVALSGTTRAALRERKDLLNDLRAELLTINPAVDVEPIDLERLKPRTLVTMMLGTVAAYLLRSNWHRWTSPRSWRRRTGAGRGWRWPSFVTSWGPPWPWRVRPRPPELPAHPAGTVRGELRDAGLAPHVCAVAVNARFLTLRPAPGCGRAMVGVAQVAAFIAHVSLLLVIGIAAGTQADLQSNPTRGAIIGIGITAMIIGGLASISDCAAGSQPDPADDRADHPEPRHGRPAPGEAR